MTYCRLAENDGKLGHIILCINVAKTTTACPPYMSLFEDDWGQQVTCYRDLTEHFDGKVLCLKIHPDKMPTLIHSDRMPTPIHCDRMPTFINCDSMPTPIHCDRMPTPIHCDRMPTPIHCDRMPTFMQC